MAVDSRPSTADEKAPISPSKPKGGLFSKFHRKKPASVDFSDEKSSQLTAIAPTAEPEIPPSPSLSCSDAIALVAAAAAGAAQPLMTLLFGNLTNQFVLFQVVINQVNQGNQAAIDALPATAAAFRHEASKDALYLVLIGIGMLICTFIYMYVWVYTAEVNAKRIRERYLQAVLRQDIQFFDKLFFTDLVQQGMSEKVALVVTFISAFITGFVLAYARSWRLALALTSLLPCIGITGTIMNKAISKYMQMSLKHVADGGSVAEEVISTVRTAQAFGTQRILSSIYDGHVQKSSLVDIKAAMWLGGGLSVFFFCIYSSYALAFSFGTTLILRGHANAGEVINVFMAILIGSFSLALLAPEMQGELKPNAITHGRGAAAKLYATIDRVPDIDSADPSGEKPDSVEGEIQLEDIQFSYPSRPNVPVVKGVSLTFKAGKTAALVGASGSGKSTVISLVERFYDPLSGNVFLDGRNIKNLNLKWLRSQIGLVSQEPTLFATTIKGNVAHGLINTPFENASDEEKFKLIKEACVKANADGFISKLPLGYDTMVGERGFLLSGGQKQRIAIARAIVSDPRILLLDEATSALDTQSEGIVQDALDKAAAGRTTITIAHRLSTIKDADVIFVMGDGLVLEQGTHNELLSKDGGAYARLVQAQKLREAKEGEALAGGEDDDDIEVESVKDMEKAAQEEIPLGRRNTGHQSLASQILEQRRKEAGGKNENDFGLYTMFKRMFIINKAQHRQYAFGSIFAIMTGMVYPAFGIVYAKAVDGFSFTGAALRHSGDRNALWFFIIALISTLCIGMQNVLFSSSAAHLTADFVRSPSRPFCVRIYFDEDKHSTGSLTSSLSENPQKVNGTDHVVSIIQSISTLVAGSVLGLVFVWKLGLVGIGKSSSHTCMPLLVSIGYIRLRVVVLKDQKNKKSHESSAQLACEAAGAIRTVASLTREDDCLHLYSSSLDEPLRQSNKTALWSNMLFAFSQSVVFYVIALVFWYGARLVSFREYSTFQFFVGLMSTTFGAIQAGNVFSFVPDISSAKGAGSDIIKLLDSVPDIDSESPEGKMVDVSKAQGHIRLENIHFRYPTRPGVRVLRELSLQVNLYPLIERFYDPLAGEIYMDGVKINELNVQDYRKQIALVSQEPTLYSGSVRFNILLGATKPESEVTQEELEQACRDANILEFIMSLPDGFDTEVGGKGSQLSGGQKQRIAIARALLRNPKVLLLDEATSALDSSSEKVVQAALDQAAKGRTTIAIAHRLSTIQNADRIYFIKEGNVSESGTHDQLLSKKGDYYEYVQLQALSKRD
ncbi:P-loop containing nucleoside triphosphate hydrolase protein [Hymenopellis radicata]|nr:P-loop containing nucleoside triphosphate hydrolase protein [Hymenopellis radicata]